MNRILEYFKYTPYDNKISQCIVPEDWTSEDFFWSKLYVNFPLNNENILNDLVSAIKSPNIHNVLFIGTSGSGKTTFLHHLDYEQKKIYGEKYVSDFFNLIEKPIPTDSTSILNTNVDAKIIDILDLQTIQTLQCIIDRRVEQVGKGSFVWDTTFLKDKEYDYHDLFDNFIAASDYFFSKQSVVQLCRNINNIPEKIALYLIAFTLKNAVPSKRKSVIVFDNLDEVSQECLLSFLNNDIDNAFSKAHDFFDKYCPEYKFSDNCTILASVRNTFASYNNANQRIDGRDNNSKTIVFDYNCRAEMSDIIERRLQSFLSQEDVSEKERNNINGTFSILKNDFRFFGDLGQLCNYDGRKVLSAMGDVFDFLSISFNNEKLDSPSLKAGARGLVLFRIFFSRMSDMLSRFRMYAEADISQDGCNMYRMLFTLLANMSYFVTGSDDNHSVNYRMARISLLEFTERIQKWYNRASVRTIYGAIFVSGNISHAIPATLSGNVVNQFIANKQYNASLSSLCDYISELYKNDKEMLSHVEILVNPLCAAYAERVFIHFEYFNVLSQIDNIIEPKQQGKSLFQLTGKDEFSSCMDRVFRKASEIIKKTDEHFCSHCKNENGCPKGKGNWRNNCMDAISTFASEKFLIKDTLYSSRVITSHIRYLDIFRQYQALLAENGEKKFDRNINLTIIEYIEKYVFLYENKAVRDDTIGKIIEEIKSTVKIAKESSRFISITKEN